jgi:hypothetical protein
MTGSTRLGSCHLQNVGSILPISAGHVSELSLRKVGYKIQEGGLPGTICSENRDTRIHAGKCHNNPIKQCWAVDSLDSERDLFVEVLFLLPSVGKCDTVELILFPPECRVHSSLGNGVLGRHWAAHYIYASKQVRPLEIAQGFKKKMGKEVGRIRFLTAGTLTFLL